MHKLLEQTFQVSLESVNFAFSHIVSSYEADTKECGKIFSRLTLLGGFFVAKGGGDMMDCFDSLIDSQSIDDEGFAAVLKIGKMCYLQERQRLDKIDIEELAKRYLKMSALGLAYVRTCFGDDLNTEIGENCVNAFKLSTCCVFSVIANYLNPNRTSALANEILIDSSEKGLITKELAEGVFDWEELPPEYQQKSVWPEATGHFPSRN